jgi:hypothetical protein
LLRRQVGAQMGDEEFAAARRLVDAARRAQASPTGSVGRSTRH